MPRAGKLRRAVRASMVTELAALQGELKEEKQKSRGGEEGGGRGESRRREKLEGEVGKVEFGQIA